MRNTLMRIENVVIAIATELFWFYHNCIAHPISGVLGLFQLKRASDWVHDFGTPDEDGYFGTLKAVPRRQCPTCQAWHDEEEAVGTMTNEETGAVINLYEGNFVDGPGNGAEVDVTDADAVKSAADDYEGMIKREARNAEERHRRPLFTSSNGGADGGW